ncbi:MAG: 23S rRNA (guanosine(2251)-2'-O)-methyltransferase RlmB [Deltaproteobacteria bacterium]|nr:23S rRNA (guanosine(2251)-2'-O)-methyltransferase RlmB [Deltaproteobacteria bacterium]
MNKPHRDNTDRTLIYGSHPVIETIKASRRKVYEIFLVKGSDADRRLNREFGENNLNLRYMSGIQLDSLTRDVKNQGVAARVGFFPYDDFDTEILRLKDSQRCLILILDQIQDPNNLGNILRSACCFGVDLVVLSKDRAVSVTPAVEKASAGSAAHVRICRVTNLNRSMETLKSVGCWIFGTDATTGTNYFEADLSGKMALVMGAEGTGLRRLVRDNCDIMIKVPMTGPIGSLNVSNATSIVLAEAYRQSFFIKSGPQV